MKTIFKKQGFLAIVLVFIIIGGILFSGCTGDTTTTTVQATGGGCQSTLGECAYCAVEEAKELGFEFSTDHIDWLVYSGLPGARTPKGAIFDSDHVFGDFSIKNGKFHYKSKKVENLFFVCYYVSEKDGSVKNLQLCANWDISLVKDDKTFQERADALRGEEKKVEEKLVCFNTFKDEYEAGGIEKATEYLKTYCSQKFTAGEFLLFLEKTEINIKPGGKDREGYSRVIPKEDGDNFYLKQI